MRLIPVAWQAWMATSCEPHPPPPAGQCGAGAEREAGQTGWLQGRTSQAAQGRGLWALLKCRNGRTFFLRTELRAPTSSKAPSSWRAAAAGGAAPAALRPSQLSGSQQVSAKLAQPGDKFKGSGLHPSKNMGTTGVP